jgi:hypothetical protein
MLAHTYRVQTLSTHPPRQKLHKATYAQTQYHRGPARVQAAKAAIYGPQSQVTSPSSIINSSSKLLKNCSALHLSSEGLAAQEVDHCSFTKWAISGNFSKIALRALSRR